MAKKYFLGLYIVLGMSAKAQIISIPDANFKAKLLQADVTNNIASTTYSTITPMKIDTNNNGEIEVSEIQSIRALDVSNSNISSLTGIESFTNLRKLSCNNNSLTSLDINNLLSLRILNCSHNSLTSLNSQNINNTISYFDCSYNNLTSLVLPNFSEFLDQGDQLIYANCSHNQLSSIVFAPNEDFSGLDLSYNNLTTIPFGRMAIYGSLRLSDNPLTSIDFSNVSLGRQHPDDFPGPFYLDNTNLTEVYIPFEVTSGSSISNNPNLVHLNIKNGKSNIRTEYVYDNEGEIIDFISYGITLDNNPVLALVCCDAGEQGYYSGIVPLTVQVTPYCNFTPGGNYNTISGSVTYNCPDGTPVNADVKIKINTNNANFTEDGNYTAFTSYGAQNVQLGFLVPSYFTVTPPNYSFNFTGTGNNVTADFCVSPNGIHPDLEIVILPIVPARPGFDAKYKLIIKNKGTETQSGSVAFSFDDAVIDYISAVPAVSAQSASLLTWNFTDLAPFEDSVMTVTFNVNSSLESPAVNLGDVLHFSTSINTAMADETPADNVTEFNEVVIGSFDPNDKTVLEGSQVSISNVGDFLHYLIRFQNMGTAAAENVVVTDALDYRLNSATLEMVSSSHPYKSRLIDGRLEVIFEGIDLPPSSVDESGSNGYIAFRVKPRSLAPVNAVIENRAGIYFDYNLPIVTNTVSTTFTALATPDFARSKFVLHPNPAKDFLNIVLPSNDSLKKATIHNVLGQKMALTNVATVDVSSLPQGTYIISVETNNGSSAQRFIKL